MPAGILRMNPDGTLVYVNDRFRAFWHLTPEQTTDEIDWARSVHPEDLERVVREWRAAVDGDGSYDSKFRIMAPDPQRAAAPAPRSASAARWPSSATADTADLLEPGMREALLNGREQSYDYHSPRDGSYREKPHRAAARRRRGRSKAW